MNALNKKMAKRTGAHSAPTAMVVSSVCSSISISKTVDFIEAGPFGSAFLFMDSIAPAGLQNDVDITVTLEAKPIGANCTFIS